MRPRIDPSPSLLALADRHGGVVTAGQATRSGLGRHSVARLIDSGSWQRLAPGLFFTQRGRPPWIAQAWGGVLLGGTGAMLGDRAAAYLHGLVPTAPARIVVWTLRPTTHIDRAPWRFRRQDVSIRLRVVVGPPAISVEDAVLDLCVGADPRQVVDLLTRAVQHRLTSPSFLLRRIDERGRVAHRRLLAELLTEVAAGAETPLELAYLRDVERAHRLPTGRRQHRDRGSGHRRDVWYEEFRTIVELDGRLGHEGSGRFRDMALDNYGALRAETTLRYGWHDVRGRPCQIARQVALVLQRAGWTGQPLPCPRCRV